MKDKVTLFWNIYWENLHTLTKYFPMDPTDGDIRQMIALIKAMKDPVTGLPCPRCREHFTQYVMRNPVQGYLKQGDMFRYFFNLHNEINKDNGKPVLTYEKAYSMYPTQSGKDGFALAFFMQNKLGRFPEWINKNF